jgi:hypothetical protein
MYAAGTTAIVSGAGAIALTGGVALVVVPFGVLSILVGLLLVRSGQMARVRAQLGIEPV